MKKHYQLHEYTIAQKQLQSLEFHKNLYREVAEKEVNEDKIQVNKCVFSRWHGYKF